LEENSELLPNQIRNLSLILAMLMNILFCHHPKYTFE